MEWMTQALSQISDALLYPCVALLLAFFAWTLIEVGRLLREAWDRRRWHPGRISNENHDGPDGRTPVGRDAPTWVRQFAAVAAAGPGSDADLERRIDAVEASLGRTVEAATFAMKVGPMLGLAGTLIPLGPVLRGLTHGDLESIANGLVVAFTTTVVGLAIAVPSLWIATVRRRWYNEDLSVIEGLAAAVRDRRPAEQRLA